jgi:hypothetical protein
MIDRLVCHADVVAIRRESYRLKDRDSGQYPCCDFDRHTPLSAASSTRRGKASVASSPDSA